MNSFETFLLLTLAASIFVGPLLGYASGRAVERAAWRRRYARLRAAASTSERFAHGPMPWRDGRNVRRPE